MHGGQPAEKQKESGDSSGHESSGPADDGGQPGPHPGPKSLRTCWRAPGTGDRCIHDTQFVFCLAVEIGMSRKCPQEAQVVQIEEWKKPNNKLIIIF